MKHSLLILLAACMLIGAGCANPFVRTEQKPSSNATTTAAPLPVDTIPDEEEPKADAFPVHMGWETYHGVPGFSFQYPIDPTTTTTWNGSERLSIALPQRSTDRGWLELDVANIPEEEGNIDPCVNAGPNAYGRQTSINGIGFELCETNEGAAGSVFHSYRYATRRGDWLVVFQFTAQSATDPRINEGCTNGTITDRSCTLFDPAIDAAVFRNIMQTFSWPDATSYELRDEIIEETTSAYQIFIRYPIMTNASFADAYNDRVRKDMRERADTFIRAAKELEEEAPANDIERMPWTLELEPSSILKDNEICNVAFFGSEYSGGAHPNSIFESYLFHSDDATFISALDYLASKGIPRSEVAKRSRDILMNTPYVQDDAEWIRTGTEPTDENYTYAEIYKDGVQITFPPYQVAPYAAGPQQAFIEFSVEE